MSIHASEEPRIRRLPRSLGFLALAVLFLSLPMPSRAQPCPGTLGNGAGASAYRFGSGTATNMFVNSGTNCAVLALGAAMTCEQSFVLGGATFHAIWDSPTARATDPTGGCRFDCPGGICFVRNNGLPVELLSFGID